VTAEAHNSDQVYVKVGDVIRLHLPYSEVCMHMRVAGKPMNVQIVEEGNYPMAQLLHDNGYRFSFPILMGEAGIRTDGDGRHYVPARAIITSPQAELE
jgi:hypothetical protein